ncbi:Cytochrome bd-type quinol oxidase [Commensalibacter communis]|uniref:Subunit 1 (AppC) n=1 Tax=Commensalibacter communis TaxID=2972786 RepID=A0A9W4TQX0_9PROT|nr:cytochrome ubiquinol oxidase subunit I [Commensalibacter communis]CAI3950828.1 Cytochrome bd-type quinol oxidase [Commensalibacter communis]CAI3951843.1 Cytochrome bd-type quinol oxidase [Commensalibacter communis]CAI3957115.1 Cytochrome bd-type quinol oxidase [Commensalibacter communis]CAI3958153.1 Cytochrome bd-type quinol oxidase [Commensalibacter communis]CAI3959192.1 Cytochrome bd-type quinol oxidase [Commensalibacter communis]
MFFGLTALELARLQFAFTVSFHIIFPATSIGLACFLAIIEWKWLRTGQKIYLDMFKYWSKIFAVAFAMGVVSGIVMAYQFGTNWSEFARIAGGVTGPLLAYEVLSAFFLEAGFLGIMLFGWGRVGPKAHFAATMMVALGTCMSMFWILSSNSWMQTPQGFTVENGIIVPHDWLQIIFNPSFIHRLLHMGTAAFLVSSLLVVGASGWQLLRGHRSPMTMKAFSMALWMVLITCCAQVYFGDAQGLNTLKYQPAKLAAIEAHWETNTDNPMALILFTIPDMKQEKNYYTVSLPYVGSLILTHRWNGVVKGLKEFPAQDRPNSLIVFWTFRLMVGLCFLMIAMSFTALWLRYKKRLYTSKWFSYFALFMGPTGYIALLAGWVTTEVGRQPWVVYNMLRTEHGFSNTVVADQVGLSLIIFVTVYTVVFGSGIYYIFKLINQGPKEYPLHASPAKLNSKDELL